MRPGRSSEACGEGEGEGRGGDRAGPVQPWAFLCRLEAAVETENTSLAPLRHRFSGAASLPGQDCGERIAGRTWAELQQPSRGRCWLGPGLQGGSGSGRSEQSRWGAWRRDAGGGSAETALALRNTGPASLRVTQTWWLLGPRSQVKMVPPIFTRRKDTGPCEKTSSFLSESCKCQ